MNFIDKKGRLFGIINIFDLFVIAVIGFLIVMSYQWHKIARDPSWVDIKLSYTPCIVEIEVPAIFADKINEGYEAFNEDRIITAKIKRIINISDCKPVVYASKGEDEKLFFNSDNKKIKALIDIRTYERRGEIYSCSSNMPLKYGEVINFHMKKYSFQGIVVDILNSEEDS